MQIGTFKEIYPDDHLSRRHRKAQFNVSTVIETGSGFSVWTSDGAN
jgi:hypothetical protein